MITPNQALSITSIAIGGWLVLHNLSQILKKRGIKVLYYSSPSFENLLTLLGVIVVLILGIGLGIVIIKASF